MKGKGPHPPLRGTFSRGEGKALKSPRRRSLSFGEGGAKRRERFLLLILFLHLLLSTTTFAVQPDEILKDPALEARARSISAGLRCLVCQNQSIDDSDAPVARDLRILIREQLVAKKTDTEVVDFVVARYGDYVLLKPRLTAQTALLWFGPFALLALGAAFLFRRRAPVAVPASLSKEEQAELDRLLNR